MPLLITFFLLNTCFLSAQKLSIEGTVSLNLKDKVVECDFYIKNLPDTTNCYFALSKIFKIRYLKDTKTSYHYYFDSFFNDSSKTILYQFDTFNLNSMGKSKLFHLSYFFVYSNSIDSLKNATTTSNYSNLYPLIFDSKQNKIEYGTCNININCPDFEEYNLVERNLLFNSFFYLTSNSKKVLNITLR